jgi:hypothetical protein
VQLPFVFYPVPWTNPAGPVTVFTDRFWDDREHWLPPGVGIVPFSMRPYFGPVPGPQVGVQQGTDDQWRSGLDYKTWIAGGYVGATCFRVPDVVISVRCKQAQQLSIGVRQHYTAFQVEDLVVNRLDQVEAINQVEDLVVNRLDQVEAINQVEDLVVNRLDQVEALNQVEDLVVNRLDQVEAINQVEDLVVYPAGILDQVEDVGVQQLDQVVDVNQVEDVGVQQLDQVVDVNQVEDVTTTDLDAVLQLAQSQKIGFGKPGVNMIVLDGLLELLNAQNAYLSTLTWKLFPANTAIAVNTHLADLGAEAAWAGYAAVPATLWSVPVPLSPRSSSTNTTFPSFTNTSGGGVSFFVVALVNTATGKLVWAQNLGSVTIPNLGLYTFAAAITDKQE